MTQFVPAGALLFALASGYATLTVYRDRQAVAETAAATTGSLTPGRVKPRGRVEALETVTSPITGEEGVVVDWSVTGETDGPGEEAGGFHRRCKGDAPSLEVGEEAATR